MSRKKYYIRVKSLVTKDQYSQMVKIKKNTGMKYSDMIRQGLDMVIKELQKK